MFYFIWCLIIKLNAGMNMIDSGSHYSRWPDPWRPEDDWGPVTAAVVFLIILAGLFVYGSANL